VDGTRLAAVVVQACGFGFGGAGDDDIEDVADDSDGAVGGDVQRFVVTFGVRAGSV
jgi:hypothetical protein